MESIQQAVIFDEQDNFLVLKYSSFYGKRTKGRWTFPAGRLEENENFEDCIKREVMEEANIEVEIICQLISDMIKTIKGKEILTISYLCKPKNKNIKLCREHCDYKWVSLKEMKDLKLINPVMIKMAEKAIETLGGGE